VVKISEPRSVTDWIASLKAGDPDAAGKLWRRYFEALVGVARNRPRGAPRAVADEEDAALSAFDSFCRGAALGKYAGVGDRGDLWRLLVVITERKAIDQLQRERQKKRGGGRIIGTLDSPHPEGSGGVMGGVASAGPDPELVAMVADECHVLLEKLRDETLRQVAMMRLEGFTSEEIADRLGCSVRSVARKLELIRRTWLAGLGTSS
jgi:DNA-directed RNA polymerase specialized sigma24 family protein